MADELLRALGRRQRQTPSAVDARAEDPLATVDPSRAQLAEMTRPLDALEREALLAAVFARVDGVAPEATPIDRAARRRTPVAWAAALAAVAAALVLFFMLRGGTNPGGPEVAALPSYAITQLDGGIAAVRSEPDAPPTEITVRPDDTIDWIVTPQTPVRDAVALVIVATPDVGPAQLLRPSGVSTSAEGVVRLRGTVASQLGLPPGQWALDLVVAPSDAVPSTTADATSGRFPTARISANISAP